MAAIDQAPALRAFAELAPDGERVGIELARALGVLCCRQRHGQGTPCTDCGDLGAALARPVARALLAVAPRNAAGKVTVGGLESVGRGLESLEVTAGLRPMPYPPDPLLTGP